MSKYTYSLDRIMRERRRFGFKRRIIDALGVIGSGLILGYLLSWAFIHSR